MKNDAIIIIVILLSFSLFSSNAKAIWFNSTFSSCTDITIDNTANSNTLTDYPVLINITNTTNMMDDFSDIRFSNSSCGSAPSAGIGELSYWVENSSPNNTWIKVDSIPASSSKIISMYFQNVSAVEAKSNGLDVFSFFDHITDPSDSINTTNWAVDAKVNADVSDSNLNITITSFTGVVNSTQTWERGYAVRGYIKYNQGIYKHIQLTDGTTMIAFSVGNYHNSTYNDENNMSAFYYNGNNYFTYIQNGNWSNYNTVEIRRPTSGNTLWFLNGSQVWSYSTSGWTNNAYIRLRNDNVSQTGTNSIFYDWILTRKYSSPEPTYNIAGGSQPYGAVTIQSPANATYGSGVIWVNATFNATSSWCGRSLNGTTNVTMTNSSGNWNNQMTSIEDGAHNVRVFCNDTENNMESSIQYFTVDTTVPTITFISPTNTTYSSSSIWINSTADKVTSWCGRSLDGTTNITMTNSSGDWHNQMTGVSSGNHNVKVFCNDSKNNMGTSIVYFKYTPPSTTYSLADAKWLVSNMIYRKQINYTMNGNVNLTDFPVTLIMDTETLISEGKMMTDCSDLRFISTGEASWYFFYEPCGGLCIYGIDYYEVENCNSPNTVIHVKTDLLYNTSVYKGDYMGNIVPTWVYYGNTSALPPDCEDCGTCWLNSSMVWTNNYYAVYHFTGDANDSSGNNRNGTVSGVSFTTGQTSNWGQQAVFVGSESDKIEVSDSFSLQNNFTIEVWQKRMASTLPPDWEFAMFSNRISGGNGMGFSYRGASQPANQNKLMIASDSPQFSNSIISDSTFAYVVMSFDDTSNILKFYINRSLDTTISTDFDMGSPRSHTTMGSGGNTGETYFYDGYMDEIRVSNTTRSAEWLNNSFNLTTTFGTEEYVGGGAQTACYDISLPANINYTLGASIVGATDYYCINITADNVTFNCNNKMIGGVSSIGSVGIYVSGKNATIQNCKISSWGYGVYLNASNNTNIYNTNISSNTIDLETHDSFDNIFYNNWFTSSSIKGIGIYNGNATIYNNVFNNTNNLYISSIENTVLNTSIQIGTRIYTLGDYIGGNYWATPTGNGWSETCSDDDENGFCDDIYNYSENAIDYLPLAVYTAKFLSSCGEGNFTILHLWVFDEIRPEELRNVNISITLIKMGTSISNHYFFENVTNATICSDKNETLNAEGQIEYVGDTYPKRNYFLYDTPLSNTSVGNISLYVLNASLASRTTFSVLDEVGSAREVYLNFQRYYTDTNTYRTVILDKTDSYGNALEYLEPYDVFYRIIILEN